MNYFDLVIEKNLGGFVAISLKQSDAKRIKKLCDKIGIKDINKSESMHMTLFFDEREIIFDEYEPSEEDFDATIKGITEFTMRDKRKALVLELESRDIIRRFNELLKMGFKTSYPEYKPHLSIKYGSTPEDYQIAKENLEKFKRLGTITFHNEYSDKLR